MASWKFEGLDEYLRQLERLQGTSDQAIGKAIYEGAGVVAKACAAAIKALPVSNQHDSNGITSVQKAGLIEGFGISHAQTDGYYRNVKLGFDGLGSVCEILGFTVHPYVSDDLCVGVYCGEFIFIAFFGICIGAFADVFVRCFCADAIFYIRTAGAKDDHTTSEQ